VNKVSKIAELSVEVNKVSKIAELSVATPCAWANSANRPTQEFSTGTVVAVHHRHQIARPA
jgi:hypothetical protein